MFAPTRYLAWAMRLYGRAPLDLATSGIPHARGEEGIAVAPEGIDDPASFSRFVEAVAAYNDRPAEEVVTALGTSHALFLAYAAMLSPGDEVLVETPGYEPLTRAAEGLGAVVRTFERRRELGFAVDPEEVAARVGPRTRAIVVSNLHNPSGVRVPDDTLRELAAIAEARGAHLLVDEVYAPFDALVDAAGVFRGSARRLAPNVVAVSSLTKCYGLGMHRIGWVLAPPAIAEAAAAAKTATMGHMPLAHAAASAAAFAELPRLSARARAVLGDKRARVEAWLTRHPAASWSAPREGLFGLVTLPGRGDLLADVERLAETSGVLVAAGSFFGAPSSFRLSWASSDVARLEEGLAKLEPLVSGNGTR